ncbi:esterase [Tersicoccus solisilvae]|uniref:Esterase n=1 Tax=Tersicoccus solisilvae TaxID=1882339 RepID=A0ABQ1NRI1_9MICC|nr:alpha/beta hydrolase [Tersicoccus solisilvae]GGC83555.1 esterase [Tersicoccus solisilvae]
MTTTPPPTTARDELLRVDGPADADPVLLLPGTAGRSGELDGLTRRLAGPFRVLRLDLPGTGRSRAWADDLPLLDVTATAAAVAALLAECGAQPRAVVGHSAGGIVAVEVARALRADSGDVAGAVLLDANLPTDPAASRDKRARAEKLSRLPDAPLREAFAASMRRSWGGRDVGGPAFRQVMDGVDAAGARVIREFWLSVLGLDSVAFWRRLELPAVYLHSDRPVDPGALTVLTDRVRYVEAAQRSAGHWIHLVEPALTGDLVHDALTSLLAPE